MYSLSAYLPAQSIQQISEWLEQHNCNLKISNPRKTKFGDYRFVNNQHHITINNDLNKYAFLVTLTHEIAHMFVFEKYRNAVLPHGTEWKMTFQRLMLNFIPILPEDIQKSISHHIKNPKASTCSDPKLFSILSNYDDEKHLVVCEIEDNTRFFTVDGNAFERICKVRTRIKCRKIANNKLYLFNPNCKIILNQ